MRNEVMIMNGKDYLAEQIRRFSDDVWNQATAITGNRLSFEATMPSPIDGGYELTEFWLRKDGAIMRRKIVYKNPRWTTENPDNIPYDVSKIIYTEGKGYLIGDLSIQMKK